MYTFTVDITPEKHLEHKAYLDLFSSFLSCLRMNGQILGREYPITQNGNTLSAYVRTPDEKSLHQEFNNKYVNKILFELGGEDVMSSKNLGEDPESGENCTCNKRTSLILFTNYRSLESPISCGNCSGYIPLYTLPKTFDDEYSDIIGWESDYQSCDRLQMNCAVGERFAMNQLSKFDSALNRIGRSICQSLSEKCSTPVYYYLYKGTGKSIKKEKNRVCPSCSGRWLLEEAYQNTFDFKCDKCCLLSNIAWGLK